MKKSTRRNFLATAAMMGAAGSISAMPYRSGSAIEPVVHHVFFWLKNPDSKEDRAKLIEGVKGLSKIETVKEIHVGVLADTEKRAVVDASWQVSELIFFHDLAGQATYQNHQVHLDFVKNYSALWQKVVVYDMMVV
jgi:hypothetical protein